MLPQRDCISFVWHCRMCLDYNAKIDRMGGGEVGAVILTQINLILKLRSASACNYLLTYSHFGGLSKLMGPVTGITKQKSSIILEVFPNFYCPLAHI
jgi:hypothetical protein